MSDDFDLEGIGLTLDDLDFADFADDLPPLPLDRPRYRPKGWWTPTDLEAFHLDLPDFEDGAQRSRYFINEMGRAALTGIAGADNDTPIFPFNDELVSLNELMASIEPDAIARLNEHR